MLQLGEGSCFPGLLVGVNVGLAFVDGIIASLAFAQFLDWVCFGLTGFEIRWKLIRIHLRNSQLGWTRQKVFHLLIGSSNVGYLLYFVLTLVAACNGWLCWSYSCGFIAMAFPRLLLFAAFLLLLSFWVDLCHQPDDEEEEEDEEHGFLEALLKRSLSKPGSPNTDTRRICVPFHSIHVGSRQKIVILATVLVFILMMTFAVVIWIGMGENPIDSSMVARVYVSLFSIAILLLGGALACYGLILCLKMRTVRSERATSEMWKIAGLAVVSVLCFTPSAFIGLLTEIPVLYHWHRLEINGVSTSLLLILYYFVGSSVPSAFVLWEMRDLPPFVVANRQDESRTITFIRDSSAAVNHRQRWTTATSAQNQGTQSSAVRFDGCHFLPPLGIVNTNKMQNEFCPLLGLLRCLSHMYVSVGLVLEYVAAHMAKWPYVLAPLESMILLICQLFGFIFKRQDYDRFRNSYFQLWVVLVQ
ncbi:hypothetical protein WN944_012502 [Citrus x changshan-huyou]|uniref:THH1/TOM1/TOM3 domain-containing protein n=2 Tax=Magnoliopsida TaxID=3398 RepID=A0AAP0QZ20_9ROSI